MINYQYNLDRLSDKMPSWLRFKWYTTEVLFSAPYTPESIYKDYPTRCEARAATKGTTLKLPFLYFFHYTPVCWDRKKENVMGFHENLLVFLISQFLDSSHNDLDKAFLTSYLLLLSYLPPVRHFTRSANEKYCIQCSSD